MTDRLLPEGNDSITQETATATQAMVPVSAHAGQGLRTLQLRVTTLTGESHVVEGSPGVSVMEVIRNAGIDGVPALCSGNCSCGTCRVRIPAEWRTRLPAMSNKERAVLERVGARDADFRLSCQIPFSESLEGLTLLIADMR